MMVVVVVRVRRMRRWRGKTGKVEGEQESQYAEANNESA